MTAAHEHNDLLRRLRSKGVRLAIDDFGTGYLFFNYLRLFPADRIKIAQVFVDQITTDHGCAAIVRATLGLARELGIDVIAEGVETQQQADLLKAWGSRRPKVTTILARSWLSGFPVCSWPAGTRNPAQHAPATPHSAHCPGRSRRDGCNGQRREAFNRVRARASAAPGHRESPFRGVQTEKKNGTHAGNPCLGRIEPARSGAWGPHKRSLWRPKAALPKRRAELSLCSRSSACPLLRTKLRPSRYPGQASAHHAGENTSIGASWPLTR